MAFDAAVYTPAAAPTDMAGSIAAMVDGWADPCPIWAAANPDRALALLFVAPRDCAAVDALVSL